MQYRQSERKLRRVYGWIGVLLTLMLEAGLAASRRRRLGGSRCFFPRRWRPWGFYNRRAFLREVWAGRGVQSGPKVGKTDTVEQAEFRRQDRRKALLIIGVSALVGVIISALAYLVPLEG